MSVMLSGGLEYSTPVANISAKPTLATNRYSDSTRNNIDRGLNISANYVTENARFSLNLDAQRDTSFDSELTTTGYIDKKVNRKSDMHSPAVTFFLDELSTISLSHSFTDVDYANGINAGLFDYQYSNTSISYSRITKTLGTISLTLADVTQEIDQLNSKYDTKIIQAGFSKQLSATISANVYAGLRKYDTNIGYANYNSSDNGWVMDLSAGKAFSHSNLSVSASREVTPSGGGYMVLKNQVSLGYRYPLSPQLTARVDAIALKNIRETESGDLNRYYGNADLGLIYNFEPNWNISLHIQHRKNHSEEGIPGKDNVIMFNVSYAGPKTPVKNYHRNTEF